MTTLPDYKCQIGAVSIIVVVLIASLLIAALQIGLQESNISILAGGRSADHLKALYLAESGIERAAYRFKSTSCSGLVEAAVTFGDGTMELSNATLNGVQCDIQVRAVVNDAVRVIAASLASSIVYDAWAVGRNGIIAGRSAGVWSTVTSGVSKDLYGVACTDRDYCVAVGQNGWLTIWNGSAWSSRQINSNETYNGISCSPYDRNFCVIAGKGDTSPGVTRLWDRSLANPGLTAVNVAQELLAISCPGSSCVAVGLQDTNAFAIRGDATTWVQESTDVADELRGVACTNTTATDCWAVSNKKANRYIVAARPGPGGVVTWEQDNSTGAPNNNDVKDLYTVSCAVTSGECWAAGKSGRAIRYSGAAWVYAGQIDTQDINGIHCRESDASCLAVGGNGAVLRWDGTLWSAETSATPKTLNAVFYLPDSAGSNRIVVNNWHEMINGS